MKISKLSYDFVWKFDTVWIHQDFPPFSCFQETLTEPHQIVLNKLSGENAAIDQFLSILGGRVKSLKLKEDYILKNLSHFQQLKELQMENLDDLCKMDEISKSLKIIKVKFAKMTVKSDLFALIRGLDQLESIIAEKIITNLAEGSKMLDVDENLQEACQTSHLLEFLEIYGRYYSDEYPVGFQVKPINLLKVEKIDWNHVETLYCYDLAKMPKHLSIPMVRPTVIYFYLHSKKSFLIF